MKTIRCYFLMMLMAMIAVGAKAQTANKLIVPDVTVQIGQAELPINIENTDELVAVQFDLVLPSGFEAQEEGRLSNRSDGHEATVRYMEGKNGAFYRVVVYSPANKAFLGQSGTLLYLPITVPDNVSEDEEYQPQINNVVLSKLSGENVVTETTVGKLEIAKLPDLTVKNITADKTTLTPGENVVVSWLVENVGGLSTTGGWSEQVSLVSEDGSTSKLIATTYYDEMLESNGIVSRQVEITLPTLLGIDGNASLQVKVVPTKDTGEATSAQGNNTLTTDALYIINKVLTLTLSPNVIAENSNKRITATFTRSGRWDEAETFTITATEDSRIYIPATIRIPAGQSGFAVYLTVKDNEVLDDNSVINISVEGNGYAAVSQQLTIEDNEYPDLTVTASEPVLTEGDTFQLTVKTSRASTEPITVTLTSENTKRFSFPQTVTISAGETSVTVDVTAVDNDEIELQESIAFYATEEKHNQGKCIILLNDNDMPTLTFKLTPEAVLESGGYAALLGTIKRTDNLDKKVTLKLSDDSNGLLSYANQTIVMAKNQQEVQFSIGVTDNDIVDGNHIATVTASVYSSSCNCSVQDEEKGSIKATIVIIDDDGPTLRIKPEGTAMLEGSEGNVFVISHNVQSDADVTVRISSDMDDMLEYDHEVTIPAGQSSVNLLINVNSNDQQDDSNVATFKVEANGYAMGTCWLMITDQTLPDAIVSLTTDKTETEAEGAVLLRAEVKNVGNAVLPSSTPLTISFSGRKETVSLKVGQSVSVGESVVVEYNYDLPAITGNYTFEATVNASGKVPELIYGNNTSEKVSISLISPFSVTAKADKDIYLQSDSIYVSGIATGTGGNNAKIEVYFINEGSRQTVTATTDEEGSYTVAWKPLSKQSGHFIVGACYPDSKVTDEMDAFDVYGVQAISKKDGMPFERCEISNTDTYSGTIIVSNPGLLNQTGLSVTPMAESDNCEFTYNVPTNIEAGESVEISYTIKGNAISKGQDWQQMPIAITTVEGSRLEYIIYYYVHPLKARLEVNKTYINTTMTLGTPREYPVTIKNTGRTETGKITLALPNWIQAVTPNEMASLSQGDSATILLRFIPTEAMKLNVSVSGRIGVNCANGDGTTISFNLTPVSEAKGTLKVDVVDEYTFFTEEAPHVSKAKVSLKNPSTNEVVAEGETADDGTFTAEIPEGYYSVTVDADKHDTYSNTVIVDPGVEKNEEVFLSYQAITYSWEVEETGVEDEYEIETIVKYETRVPKPVVIVTLPDEQPEPNSIIPVIVTNKGLVNAVDVNMSLSISNGYKLEFLNDPILDVLAPQQAHIFYAKMVPDVDEEAGSRAYSASRSSVKCYTLIARARYKELCQKYTGQQLAEAIKKWGNRYCVSSGYGSGGGNSSSYGPGYPGNWGNTNYDSYYRIWDTDDPALFCDKKPDNPDTPDSPVNPGNPDDPNNPSNPDNPEIDPNKDPFWTPCKNDVLAGISNCAGSIGFAIVQGGMYSVPGLGCAYGLGTSCVLPAINKKMTGFAFLGCLSSVLGCFVPGEKMVEKLVVSGIGCLATAVDVYLTCTNTNIFGDDYISPNNARPNKYRKISEYDHEDPFDNYMYKLAVAKEESSAFVGFVTELFGNESWINTTPEEITNLINYLGTIPPEAQVIIDENLIKFKPSNISSEVFQYFIERYNNTTIGYDSNYQDMDNYIHSDVVLNILDKIDFCEDYALSEGYMSSDEMLQSAYNSFVKYLESIMSDEDFDDSPSICSTVTLSFKQKNVMTRQAFRGTLTVNNGNETTAMKDVKMNLEVRDMDGNLTTSHEFQIDAESLNGFTGNLDFTSGWTLEGGGTGLATILFIPTKYAAPTEPKDYSFGGSFSYTDPYTGLTVTRDLNPVTLTVNPSPNLEMTYFMQRDVFGDDPLTETVEPMIPSEFALIVNNKGYGDAENMNLTTHQPEIIDNQKGLAISFELISTQLNGGDKNLSLGGSMTSDFGTIPAHSQAYAQWWLQSSLLGHFIEYDVKATHLTSRNNPDLSLLDTVTIHELIHGFTVRKVGDKPLRGFLVNDIKDSKDMPDEVYFTDATQQSVYIASSANIVKQSETEFVLNVNASVAGWNYGSILDPTNGKQNLVKVVRADGTEVNIDNVWQTDRILRDGKDWLYENRLHFVGDMSANGETFYLTFEPRPEVELEVVSIGGLPEEGSIAIAPVDEITVDFTKEINPETFTTDDIALAVQGVKQDVGRIGISTEDNKTFTLDLSELNEQLGNGYYTLTIQTADISDTEGYQGKTGKQVGWIMFRGGLVQLLTSAYPKNSGNVQRKTTEVNGARRLAPNDEDAENSAQYGSTVTLVANPSTGYEFSNWTLNGEIVSNDPEYTATALGDMNVVANFTKKRYMVEIASSDDTMGSVTGTGTGIYEHGTKIEVTAVPGEDYALKNWTVGGEAVGNSTDKLTLTAEGPLTITAEFLQEFFRQSMTLARGWNWMSAYLSEPLAISDLSRYVNRIVSQTDELINDPEYGLIGGISELEAGKAYKIEANSRFTNTFRGHLYNVGTAPLTLHKGWNWVAYPNKEQTELATAITNAEEGDYIASQTGFAEYAEGGWEGTLDMLTPGAGYLYKSATNKTMAFDFTASVSGSRAWKARTATVTEQDIDIHRYPNTMNVTARLYRDGSELAGNDYVIYAMVGNEIRGISQCVSDKHYLTVYGDGATEISFVIEDVKTGDSYIAKETLVFRSDVIGSRKAPFGFNISGATGIDQLADSSRPMTVYTVEGILVSRDATLKTLRRLPKGVYVVNGQKCYIK